MYYLLAWFLFLKKKLQSVKIKVKGKSLLID